MDRKIRLDYLLQSGLSKKTAEQQLQKLDVLAEFMARGVTEFQYKKKDGTIRTAHGTTQIPSTYHFVGKPSSAGVFPYWDCDVEGWRCFNIKNLI